MVKAIMPLGLVLTCPYRSDLHSRASKDAAHAAAHQEIDIPWEIVRDAPQTIAFRRKEFIVQLENIQRLQGCYFCLIFPSIYGI